MTYELGAINGPTSLVIMGTNGTELIVIDLTDGSMMFGPDYTPDETARTFWAAVTGNDPLSTTSVSEGGVWRRLTWKEIALDAQEKVTALGRWQALCMDLDRCEHGRHEGDICDGCGGPSHGNYDIDDEKAIGHDIGGNVIRVPPRGPKNDPADWIERLPRAHGA